MSEMRTKRLVVVSIVLIAALFGGFGSAAGGPGPPSPFPSDEEIAQHGFAIWPEDSAEEAQEACTDHADDQPWRLSAKATARRFARLLLGHEEPHVDDEASQVYEHNARIWLYAKEVFLSNIVELRRAGVCWFITHADPREDGPTTTPVFTRRHDFLRVYFEHSYRVSNDYEEIGFGRYTKTFPPTQETRRRYWIVPEEAYDEEGHVLHLGWQRGSAETAWGRKLPPPPEIGAGDQVFPVGERFSWEEIPKDERGKACRRSDWTSSGPRRALNEVLEWAFSRAMPSGPYPDVLKTGRRGWIGEHVYVSWLATGVWNVRIHDVAYRFEFARATDNCWALDRIAARRKDRPVEEAFYDDTAVTLDFLWKGAGKVEGSVGYGEDTGSAVVHRDVRSRVAFYRPEYSATDPPGLIFVKLLTDGKYVNAYMRRLPPPSS